MFRCAGCSGTGRPAAVNAPGVTRTGSRRPAACQGTNIAPRSTAGTTYCLDPASGTWEPGLLVTAFTDVPDRRQDTGTWLSGLLRPAHPSPAMGRRPRYSPTRAGARPHQPTSEQATVPTAPSPTSSSTI